MPTHIVRAVKIHPQKLTDTLLQGTSHDELEFVLSTGLGLTYREFLRSEEFRIGEDERNIDIDWRLFELEWSHNYYRISVVDTDTFAAPECLGTFKVRLGAGDVVEIEADNDTVWDGDKVHFSGRGVSIWIWFTFELKP